MPVQMPERMSPSSVSTWLQCQLKYKYSRIDKMHEEQTEPQALGNMTHEALEELFNSVEPGGRTLQVARTIMLNQWHQKWQKHAEEVLGLSPYAQHMLRWNAWSCVENYFKLEDPNDIEPDGVEEEVFGEIEGVPILGFIDRRMPGPNGCTIQDYKTGKVSKPPYDKDKILQLMIYTELVESTMGEKVAMAELIYLKGKGSRVSYEPTEEARLEMRKTVLKSWGELKTACETDNFTTHKTKLCDWCSFKGICPAWKRK